MEMTRNEQADWVRCSKKSVEMSRCLLYWRKPAEWASIIYTHYYSIGQLNSVLTIAEIFYSDDSKGEEFCDLPESMWRRALAILEKQGKAHLFDSENVESSMNLGVKFF